MLNEGQSAQWHYSFYCRRGLRTKSSRSALKFGLASQVETSRQTIRCSLSNSKARGESHSPPSLFRRPPVESEYAPPSGLVIWCCVNWFNCCSRRPVQKRALTALVKDENCPVKRSRLRPLRGGGCLSQFAFFGDVMRIRLVYPANKEHFHRSYEWRRWRRLRSYGAHVSGPIWALSNVIYTLLRKFQKHACVSALMGIVWNLTSFIVANMIRACISRIFFLTLKILAKFKTLRRT